MQRSSGLVKKSSASADQAGRGKWMALTAALLGWMFDGFEMGLFPLVGRTALGDLLHNPSESVTGTWFGVVTAGFLVGAATGGVLFGWLGDRIGRVRAMTLSVLTYAVFSGLCGLAPNAVTVCLFRFIAALGMGGEWSLGVALVMEIWPNQSRAFLAGLIGAAANVGYLLVGLLGMFMSSISAGLHEWVVGLGLTPEEATSWIGKDGWRVLLLSGAFPAGLTFLIRLFVPESHKWEEEHGKGTTSHWATRDLLGVLLGALGPTAMIYVWANPKVELSARITVTLIGLLVACAGYLYPVVRFIQRSGADQSVGATGRQDLLPMVGRLLLGAGLGGVALLGTWASLQWASVWADKLAHELPEYDRYAKSMTSIFSSLGAIVGTILGAYLGNVLGRRVTYFLLCLVSLGASWTFFHANTSYGPELAGKAFFWGTVFLGGATTASFYGWLPLYLPELFPTRLRATGQGFSFNFGRILAAVGALQIGAIMAYVEQPANPLSELANSMGLTNVTGYPVACSIMSLIYLVGAVLIWFAPETKGKPLPE